MTDADCELDIKVIACPDCATSEDEYLDRLIAAGLVIDDLDDESPACRVCGCTDRHGCPDVPSGCSWVDTDDSGENGGPLCSECAPERLEPCQC